MEKNNWKEFIGSGSLSGPILTVPSAGDITLGEVVEVMDNTGAVRSGIVLRITEQFTFVQVYGGSAGISRKKCRVSFLGHSFSIPVTRSYMGRIFNGKGAPIDGGGRIVSSKQMDVNGAAINPCSRAYPREFIQTGVSVVDGMNSIVRGQKIGIFSGAGMPHNVLAAQILSQAKLPVNNDSFCVILAGMGITRDDAHYFMDVFNNTGQAVRSVLFLNLADDPPEEMILTPRIALTLAEYLAFEEGMHVLVILTDITNYCEALREISSFREEIPSRKGYPGYMYTDLASLYERTGRIRGKNGSITQIPILTMPNMDITHPIADLSGYITEGQIVFEQELFQKGIYPPVNVLPSLSRLMKDGIGEGQTREDHADLSNQLYYAYSESRKAASLASIIGIEDLAPREKSFLDFGTAFEQNYLSQGTEENREILETLASGWRLLSKLPRNELHRVKREQIEKYLRDE